MIVVDASVAAKWLLTEPDASPAMALLKQGEPLHAPSIVRMEVTSAIVRAVRDGRLTGERALALCDNWERMLSDGVLLLSPADQVYQRAIHMAIEVRHTLPDCLYVALGEAMHATVVTADKAMHERGSKVYPSITLLGAAP